MENTFFDTSDLSPRDMLRETLGDLPISGGWGYGPDDAIIIEDDDAMESAASDYDIIDQRTILEIKDMAGLKSRAFTIYASGCALSTECITMSLNARLTSSGKTTATSPPMTRSAGSILPS